MKHAIWITAVLSFGCSSPTTVFSDPDEQPVDSGGSDAGADASEDMDAALDLDAHDDGSDGSVGPDAMPDMLQGPDAMPDMFQGPDAMPDLAVEVDAMPENELHRTTCERVDAEGRRTDWWVLDGEQRAIAHDDHGPFSSLQGQVIAPSEEPAFSEYWTYDADGNVVEEFTRRGRAGRDIEVSFTWEGGLLVRRDTAREWDGTVTRSSTIYVYEAGLLSRETERYADGAVRSVEVTTYDAQRRRVRRMTDWSQGEGDDFVPADGQFDRISEWTYPEPNLAVYAERFGEDEPIRSRTQTRSNDQGRVIERLIDNDADGTIDVTFRFRYENDLLVWSESGTGDPQTARVLTFAYEPTRKTSWLDGELRAQTDCSAPVDFNRVKAP